jgi:phage repressor protein C with HTH and peptisase S24 domain
MVLEGMRPTLECGELVLVKVNEKEFQAGDVVAFVHPFSDFVMFQRIVNMYNDGKEIKYVVRSDEGVLNIFDAITKEDIIGRVIM